MFDASVVAQLSSPLLARAHIVAAISVPIGAVTVPLIDPCAVALAAVGESNRPHTVNSVAAAAALARAGVRRRLPLIPLSITLDRLVQEHTPPAEP
jgi:hypothetical protein